MIRYFIVLLIFCSFFGMASPKGEAIRFVEEFGLGSNLKPMAARTAMEMTTFKIILDEVGKEKAQKLIVSALEESILKYQDDWNESLAMAYLEHFSVKELKSIRENKKASPYFSDVEKKTISYQQVYARQLKAIVGKNSIGGYAKCLSKSYRI